MEMLKSILWESRTKPTAPTTSSAHVAQRVNSFLSKQENLEEWIVDSGASDHMTGSANLFSSYKRCDGDMRITVADGTSFLVAGIGDVNLCGLSLKYVLYDPNLKHNLISVSKISKDQNCAVTLSPNGCEFQDLDLGMMISNAEERSGLYFFPWFFFKSLSTIKIFPIYLFRI